MIYPPTAAIVRRTGAEDTHSFALEWLVNHAFHDCDGTRGAARIHPNRQSSIVRVTNPDFGGLVVSAPVVVRRQQCLLGLGL